MKRKRKSRKTVEKKPTPNLSANKIERRNRVAFRNAIQRLRGDSGAALAVADDFLPLAPMVERIA